MHWLNTVNHFDCLRSDVEKNVGNSLSLLAHWFCFIILCRCWRLDRSVIPLRTKIILCFSEIKVNSLNLRRSIFNFYRSKTQNMKCVLNLLLWGKKKTDWGFLLDSSKHTIILLKLMQIFLSDCEAKRDIWIKEGDLACVDEETLTKKYDSDLRKYGKLLKL